jgi:hypothetical protein
MQYGMSEKGVRDRGWFSIRTSLSFLYGIRDLAAVLTILPDDILSIVHARVRGWETLLSNCNSKQQESRSKRGAVHTGRKPVVMLRRCSE